MKYIVTVKEVNYGGVEVEAATPQEAEEKAEQEYYNGNVFWKNSDVEYPSVKKADRDRGDAR